MTGDAPPRNDVHSSAHSAHSAALLPVMTGAPEPTWDDARWIGTFDVAELDGFAAGVDLRESTGYRFARFLVRDGAAVRGFVEVPVRGNQVTRQELQAEVAQLPAAETLVDLDLPPITIATTTRNRPQNIPVLLDTLLQQDYPDFEVVIVDNASDGPETMKAVAAFGDDRVTAVREPLPGASRGRNTALLVASHGVVAFVDDDVVADRLWLRGVARGFSRSGDVGIVTGMVPSGELISAAQGFFEARINWEITGRHRVFSLSDPPADIPMFPFEVGAYGTGANFAIRRDYALQLGGLNEALGTGSPAGGGEDIDLFVRMLYAGHDLVYEPTSVIWHRHRRDVAELEAQIVAYGRGFGAWIAAVLADRRMRKDAIRLIARGIARTSSVGAVGASDELPLDLAALRRSERLGMLSGPFWYARSRLDRRLARPLASR